LDAITLEVMWQQIYDATPSARGLACGVGQNEEVYMAGIVENGGTLDAMRRR